MTTCVAKTLAHYLRHTRAVSALEYAILVGVIAVVMAAALGTFSGDIEDALDNIGGKFSADIDLKIGGK